MKVATPSNITYETPREESTGQPSSPESLPSSFDENNLFYIEHDDNLFKTPSQEQEGSALPTSPKPHTPFNDDGIDVNGHYIDELHIHTPVLDNTAGILISHDINANQDLGIISNADFILDNIPGELPILKGVSMVDDLSNLQPISLESYYHLAAHALEELFKSVLGIDGRDRLSDSFHTTYMNRIYTFVAYFESQASEANVLFQEKFR